MQESSDESLEPAELAQSAEPAEPAKPPAPMDRKTLVVLSVLGFVAMTLVMVLAVNGLNRALPAKDVGVTATGFRTAQSSPQRYTGSNGPELLGTTSDGKDFVLEASGVREIIINQAGRFPVDGIGEVGFTGDLVSVEINGLTAGKSARPIAYVLVVPLILVLGFLTWFLLDLKSRSATISAAAITVVSALATWLLLF